MWISARSQIYVCKHITATECREPNVVGAIWSARAPETMRGGRHQQRQRHARTPRVRTSCSCTTLDPPLHAFASPSSLHRRHHRPAPEPPLLNLRAKDPLLHAATRAIHCLPRSTAARQSPKALGTAAPASKLHRLGRGTL